MEKRSGCGARPFCVMVPTVECSKTLLSGVVTTGHTWLSGLFGHLAPSVTSGTSGTDGAADGTSAAGVKSVWNVSAGSEGL